MVKESEWLSSVLPDHYKCEPVKDGVWCYSKIGIVDEELWEYICESIKQKFGKRFMEIYHLTCTYHLSFDVYLREGIMATETHEGISEKSFNNGIEFNSTDGEKVNFVIGESEMSIRITQPTGNFNTIYLKIDDSEELLNYLKSKLNG